MKIAVIGLGVAGLSVCARLAAAGHDVSGFEQFDLTHRHGASHGDTRIIRLTPGEGPLYVRLAARAHALWRDWERQTGAALIDWTGGLMAGPPGSAFVRSCLELGGVALTSEAAANASNAMVRFPHDWDVCRQDDCGVIAAEAARAFLAKHAADCGARLCRHVRIDGEIAGASVRIGGEIARFDRIIVCAGAWAGRLLPEFAGMLSVKRRIVGWFRGPAGEMPVLCVDNEAGLFGMAAPGDLYKIGLHTVGETVEPERVRAPDAADAALLSAQIAAHLPLHDPTPLAIDACLYTLTPDENFLIAPSIADARVLMLSCCSGHGFKYAPVYGELALEWIEGRPSPELEAFATMQRTAATGLGGAKR